MHARVTVGGRSDFAVGDPASFKKAGGAPLGSALQRRRPRTRAASCLLHQILLEHRDSA